MAITGSKKTIKSTEDLIKESRLRQEKRMRQIAIMKEEKEKQIAYVQEVQNTAEEAIIGEQNRQRYTGNKDKDNETLSNWQYGRNKEYAQKQASRRVKSYGTKTPVNIRQQEIKKKRKEEEEKDPRKRAIKAMQERTKEEAKTRIKQKAAQAVRKAAQIAARVAAQAAGIVARGLIQAAGWLLAATVAAIGIPALIAIAVIIIIVVVIAVIYQTCNTDAISSAICEGVSWVGSLF